MLLRPLPCLALALLAAIVGPPAWADAPSPRCSNATLKGTYLYNHVGILEGQPYAESGREVYDGKGGIVLVFQGSDGAGGTEKATYSVSADCIAKAVYADGQTATSFLSPDGRRFTYTITAAPGAKPTALSGSELRVAP